MKTLSAIIGLTCLATTVAVPWFYDWRAGLLVLLLTIAWTAFGTVVCLRDRRERAVLQSIAEARYHWAEEYRLGWKRAHRQWGWALAGWFLTWLFCVYLVRELHKARG